MKSMKKALILFLAIILALSLCSCSIIRNKIANTIKGVAAELSREPVTTEEPAEATALPSQTEAPEDTLAVESKAPSETGESTVEETAAPQTNSDMAGGWPEGLPDYIPVFTSGTVKTDETFKYESDESITYNLNFTNVKKKDVEDYKNALKKSGLEVYTSESSNTYSVTATLQKDNNMVAMIVVYLDTSSDKCTITLMLYTAK
jgi:hypothetical protein